MTNTKNVSLQKITTGKPYISLQKLDTWCPKITQWYVSPKWHGTEENKNKKPLLKRQPH